jgi:hypothetical protein
MKRLFLMVAAMALVAAGCATDGADDSTDVPVGALPRDTTESLPASGSDTPIDPGDGIGDGTEGEGLPAVSPDLAEEVDSAMADLASRLPADMLIGVTVAHELTWPDGSLGCPEPGMSYTQVLVPGYRIELIADGAVYEYHGALGSAPFLCESAMSDLAPAGSDGEGPDSPMTIEEGLTPLIEVALADLASRLGVAKASIAVIAANSVVWPDAALGCPIPDMRYRQVPVDGAQILLEHGGRVYAYHSGGDRGPFLCADPSKVSPPSSDGSIVLPGVPDGTSPDTTSPVPTDGVPPGEDL